MPTNTKCSFMSGPHANASLRRTWLVKVEGEPSYLVRIFPNPDGSATFVCDCNAEQCQHVNAAAVVDARKFAAKEGTN